MRLAVQRVLSAKLVKLGAIWTTFSIIGTHMLVAFRYVYSDKVLILEQELSLEEVCQVQNYYTEAQITL
jgi:hypothetical protein